MRTGRRIAALFSALALLLLTAAGCRGGGENTETETNRISKVTIADYTIVYSAISDRTEEKKAAIGLRDSLRERYGHTLPMATDRDTDGSGRLILVGTTSHEQSTAAAADLTREDWTVRTVGDTVVLLGGCSEKLEAAVAYFLAGGVAEDGSLNPLSHTERHTYEFAETALSVTSLNLRTARSAVNNNQSLREPRIVGFVGETKPDSIGTQECTTFWRARLDETFESIGYKRAQQIHPNPEAMKNYIWYNPQTVKAVESGYFWLSETPTYASKGFGSDYYISAAWVILESRSTGVRYVHVNTHLDAYHEDIRLREVEVLLSYLNDFRAQGLAVFLTGDLNSTPDSPILTALHEVLTDGRATAEKTVATHTYNAYANDESAVYPSRKTIDYCLFAGPVTATRFSVTEKQNGGYLSDHNALTLAATICKR